MNTSSLPSNLEHFAPNDPLSVVFLGTAEFAVPSLERLVENGHRVTMVVTRAARPAGRGRRETQPPIADAATRLGLPLFQPERVRRTEAVAEIANERPDILVVAAYGQILPTSVLEIPRLGCLNVHASLLPRHRGASPISAAILAGDEVGGVSIMLMDAGMDTGPVIRQAATAIADQDDQQSLTARLATLGADLLVETIPSWASDAISPSPQDEALATLTRPTVRADGELDWTAPAVDLWRRIRAFSEWPQGFTSWNGKLLRIASATYDPTTQAEPGLVISHGPPRRVPNAAAIGTREGVLIPRMVVLEGRKPMPIDAFLAGHSSFIGSHLGINSSS